MPHSRVFAVPFAASLALIDPASAQVLDVESYWDGFYMGILGTGLADTDGSGDRTAGLGGVAGAGRMVNDTFYFGAEAQLAAETFNGGGPYLWLEADGRLGARVTDTMMLFTSAGVGYDTSAQEIALTGGAGAEIDLANGFALRAQYKVQHYPAGSATSHGGQAGMVFKFD